MKKTGVIIGIAFMLMILPACKRITPVDVLYRIVKLTEGSHYEENDQVKEELGELSEDEKRILSRDGYYDKERIYAGALYSDEIRKVKNIRAALSFLSGKYPDHAFKFTLYETRGNHSSSPTGNLGDDLIWLRVDDKENKYWVKVIETENGLSFEDNLDIE